jgi:hypothetical protein
MKKLFIHTAELFIVTSVLPAVEEHLCVSPMLCWGGLAGVGVGAARGRRWFYGVEIRSYWLRRLYNLQGRATANLRHLPRVELDKAATLYFPEKPAPAPPVLSSFSPPFN